MSSLFPNLFLICRPLFIVCFKIPSSILGVSLLWVVHCNHIEQHHLQNLYIFTYIQLCIDSMFVLYYVFAKKTNHPSYEIMMES